MWEGLHPSGLGIGHEHEPEVQREILPPRRTATEDLDAVLAHHDVRIQAAHLDVLGQAEPR